MTARTPLYRARPDAIDCPLGDGVAVLDPVTNTYFSLNRSGALLWQAAREPASEVALQAALRAAYPSAPAQLEADVRALIAELVDSGLFLAETTPALAA